MNKERNTTLDLIKTMAILGVIAIHTVSRVLTGTPVGSLSWTSGLFWGSIFRGSVPLFLMVSGALMLNPEKPLSLRKLYFKSILRIIAAMLFWGFLYKIYHLIAADTLSLQSVWYSVKRLVLFDQEFHFYYIHMILIVYIFLPVLRFFAQKADKKLLTYALLIWFIFGIIYPTARGYFPFNLMSGLTNQWEINLTYSSLGYALLGYYLNKYGLSLKTALISFVSGFAIVFGLTFYLSAKEGYLNETFIQGTSLGVFIMATGIFSLAKHIRLKGFIKSIVIYISKASFLVYLSHMFILYIFEKYSVTALSFHPIISVPLISVGVLVICLGIYGIISKIPLLKKWIV